MVSKIKSSKKVCQDQKCLLLSLFCAIQKSSITVMQSSVIFPLFYLPPISFFKEYLPKQDNSIFEVEEHFLKQTYRNRATILSPHGKLDLIIPVIKGASSLGHTKFKDVQISYDSRWQNLHWRSFESCYRSSAYFEYYEAEFRTFFEKQPKYLIDLNTGLLAWILQKLKKPAELNFSNQFKPYGSYTDDYRLNYNPKKELNLDHKIYFQVFDDRNGFQKNMSIVDLLFNQGPQSLNYI